MLLKILTVAGLATFELYAAIPAGFAFHLSPWTIFCASGTGGLAGVFIATFLGDKIKAFIAKYKKPKGGLIKTDTLAHRLWNKFGVVGLGLIGTVTVGAPVSIAVGIGLNAQIHKLIIWCCVGVITRCIAFTLAGHYGLKIFL